MNFWWLTVATEYPACVALFERAVVVELSFTCMPVANRSPTGFGTWPVDRRRRDGSPADAEAFCGFGIGSGATDGCWIVII
eukprot:502792-Pleurochrysis_carterae.AAC.2